MSAATAMLLAAVGLSSPDLREFYRVPDWAHYSVPAANTPGSPAATNATKRIDEDEAYAVSAVYAPFAAFAERAYYFSAGASNRWDAADYGDTTDMKKFRFSLPSNATPAFVFDPDTNRTIRSRRFSEYSNLDALADALSGTDISRATSVTRPSWPTPTNRWWSSSAFDALGSSNLPTFAWTTYAPSSIATTAEWGRVCMTFNQCALKKHERGDPIDWHVSDDETIAHRAWRHCNFGEPPFDSEEWSATEVPFAATNALSTAEVVSAMFGETVTTNVEVRYSTNLVTRLYEQDWTPNFTMMINYYASEMFGEGVTNFWIRFTAIYNKDLEQNDDGTWTCSALPEFDMYNAPYPGGSVGVSSSVGSAALFDHLDVGGYNLKESDVTVTVCGDAFGFIYSRAAGTCFPAGNITDPTNAYPFTIATTEVRYEVTNIVRTAVLPGLTNETRRLYRDRLAAVDQCLGALDRTVSICDSSVFHVRGDFTTNALLEADSVTAAIDWDTMMTDGASGTASWRMTSDVGGGVTNSYAIQRRREAVCSMTALQDTAVAAQNAFVVLGALNYSAPIWGGNIRTNFFYIRGAFSMISGDDLVYGLEIYHPDAGELELYSVTAVPMNITLERLGLASRSYSFMMATNETVDTFPAQGVGNIRSGRMSTLASRQVLDGTSQKPITGIEPAYGSTNLARTVSRKCFDATFDSAAKARRASTDAAAEMRDAAMSAFSAATGARPDQTDKLAPLGIDNVRAAFNACTFAEASVALENDIARYNPGGGTTNYAITAILERMVDEETGELEFVGFQLETGEIVKPALPFPIMTVSLVSSSSARVDTTNFTGRKFGENVAVRYETISQTEWKWNSLRSDSE